MAAPDDLLTLPAASSSTSVPARPAWRTPQLPVELVIYITQHLSAQDLRNVAATCHQFHTAAYHHAGLVMHVSLSFFETTFTPAPPHEPSYIKELATFRDVVNHAAHYDLRVSLSLNFEHDPRNSGRRLSESTEAVQSFVSDTCVWIRKAFPLLVDLDLSFSTRYCAALAASLCQAAPQLRKLVIRRWEDTKLPVRRLPPDILGGFAPKLTYVNLDDIVPDESTVFPMARTVIIGWDAAEPAIRLTSMFPIVTDLTISRFGTARPDSAILMTYDLHGLSLSRLTIEDGIGSVSFEMPTIGPARVFYDTRVVRYFQDPPDWCTHFWSTVLGPLNVRIVYSDSNSGYSSCVTIACERDDRVRIYEFDSWDPNIPQPLIGLEFLSPRLSYIRLARPYVSSLLHFTAGFPQLRRLRIDLHIIGGRPGNRKICEEQTSVRAPCPVLEQLMMFAEGAPTIISCDQINTLARAFGQVGRTSPASLTLVGISLIVGRTASPSSLAFPAVEYCPYSGTDSDAYNDFGLWDH